ncbi:MAG TPA: T9SS type A sorting domain-containing protein [Bacteroidia bacterium]|nr:T9SS type A sorting domain-containing protein [Bacteroidia bacterium]
MLQGTAADTLLRNWYDSTTVANIGLFKTVSDPADVNPEYALTLNESINPDNHAEENEKAVNAIYLITWALDTFDFSPGQYEILYAIANEVPLTGGIGVYAARVMLGLHIDDDYESIGSRMANPDKTNQSAAVADNKIKLMPNPATNETIYLNHHLKSESGVVTVYTKMGVAVESFLIHEGNNRIAIDLQKLSQGIYIVETKVNNRIKDVRKLVVIR